MGRASISSVRLTFEYLVNAHIFIEQVTIGASVHVSSHKEGAGEEW